MAEVLFVVLLAFLVVVGGTVAVAVAALHAVAVSNRVVPGRPTPAPLIWTVAPEQPARLHRRLRAAVALAGAASGPQGIEVLDDVVRQLQDRAVELDHQLVLARRHRGAPRRRMLRELQAEVAELEGLSERAVRMSRAWRDDGPATGKGLQAVRERLELLEAALEELDAVGGGTTTIAAGGATPSR